MKESVDVVPAGSRGDVTSGGNDEVGMDGAFFQQSAGSAADGFRSAVAEFTGKIGRASCRERV